MSVHLRITELAERVEGLGNQLLDLARHVAEMSSQDAADDVGEESSTPPYKPRPPVRWWQAQGQEREDAVAYLEAWTQDIYLPGFGHLSGALPDCWTGHTLCLYCVEAISEMFLLLEMTPRRSAGTLAGLIELILRTIPAAVHLMAAECGSCPAAHAAQVRRARAVLLAGAP